MSEQKTLKEYEEEIRRRMLDHDELVIYGAGKMGQLVHDFLMEKKIQVNSFCVSTIKNHEDRIKNLPVRDVSYFFRNNKKTLFLISVRPPANKTMKMNIISQGGVEEDIIDMTNAGSKLDQNYLRPMLEITPKIGCKINCKYCPQNTLIEQYFKNDFKRKQKMSFDDFKNYIDKTPQDLIVQFMGFVEPFLCDNIIDMMWYAHEAGHDMTLSTTLVGLTAEQFESIREIPFRLVILHLPDAKGYAHIKVDDNYMKILDCITNATRRDGRPFIDVCNAQCEPDPIVADYLKNTFPISWNMNSRAGNLNDTSLPDVGEKDGEISCVLSPSINHNVLLPDGSIVLCCMDFGMRHVLGNLSNDRYENIMEGKEIKHVRKAMKEKRSDILCRKCAYAY